MRFRSRRVIPLVGLLILAGFTGISMIATDDHLLYVVYRGERYPLHEAASFHACHDLARPEIRCFDSWIEVEADFKRNFPLAVGGLHELLPDVSFAP